MHLIYRKDLIDSVPEAWDKQYRGTRDADKRKITARLQALAPREKTAERIDAIIGNSSWTTLWCDECGESKEVLMHFGAEPDYDVTWQDLCTECLQKALAELSETAEETPT